MKQSKAIVRWHVERISGVVATWFEWTDDGDDMISTLVVEVDFDTDPNSTSFSQNVIDAIESTVKDVLQNETTMAVSHLRIIPARAATSI